MTAVDRILQNFTVLPNTVKPSPFTGLIAPRVLIVALSGIGNLLMASPLFRALTDANPTAELDVLVAPRGTAAVLEANPRIRRILRGSPWPSLPGAVTLSRLLRRGRYDVGLITHPGQLVWSASLLALGGVRRRIGHRYSWQFLRESGAFFTDPIDLLPHAGLPLADRSAHDVAQNLNLLRPLGISVEPATAVYDFPLAPDDRRHADDWLAAQQLAGATLIGCHPGAHRDLAYKRWPTDRWAALGDRLAVQFRATLLVFGSRDEHALTAEVCARMHAPAIPVDLPLRTTAALLGRCLLVVSNDSGLMHVSVSQNVPTFGLFGPTDERRTAPWGTTAQVIRALGAQPTYDVTNIRAATAAREPDPSLLALLPEAVFRDVTAVVPISA